MSVQEIDIEAVSQQYMANPSQENMDKLIQSCQGLIYHYAKLYGGGYCFEDICQCGYEGLLKAVKNFDPGKDVRFVTYSSHAIIGEIRHCVRKERRYYFPQYLENYQKKADDFISSNIQEENEPLSNDALADMLNLKPDSVLPVMGAGLVHLGHLEINSIKAKEMESFTLPVEDKLLLSQLMYHLTGVQKDVILMLFHKGMSQEEVAAKLGLTQKQVSRIKLKSIEKMNTVK